MHAPFLKRLGAWGPFPGPWRPRLAGVGSEGRGPRGASHTTVLCASLWRVLALGGRGELCLTGAGKTFIAVNLMKRIADAGQLKRALFVCDRDELRAQGLGAFQNGGGLTSGDLTSKTRPLPSFRDRCILLSSRMGGM
jgi:Type III restriction enzyme, res subunit